MLLRFSFKEAVFKALHPLLRRPISFQEVSVYPDLRNPPPPSLVSVGDGGKGMSVVRSGSATLHFHLTQGEIFDNSAQVKQTGMNKCMYVYVKRNEETCMYACMQ